MGVTAEGNQGGAPAEGGQGAESQSQQTGGDQGAEKQPGAGVMPSDSILAERPGEAEGTGGQQHSDETSEDEQKGDQQEPETRAPEQYEAFTLPEGTELDEAGMEGFKTFAKEQDLTQDQAQRVLAYGAEQFKERLEAPYKAWSEMQEKWKGEVKADAEIGGTKYDASVTTAGYVFVPGESNPYIKTAEEAEALRTALKTTGAGNNPAIVKLFVRMGAVIGEPKAITEGKPNVAANTRDGQGATIYDTLYPTMSGNKSGE